MKKDYMYAVDRSDEYLAHYGIKGMKWGVRKAIESGNARKLDRAYRKASRKLARLEKQANSGKKYARRAAVLGAGAAAAGGLAAAGTQGVANAVRGAGQLGSRASHALGRAGMTIGGTMKKAGIRGGGRLYNASAKLHEIGTKGVGAANAAGNAVSNWGNQTAMKLHNATSRNYEGMANVAKNYGNNALKRGNLTGFGKGAVNAASYTKKAEAAKTAVSNNTLARIGAGVAAAGLAGATGYNAYRAATTKRAAQKAQQFRSEMNKAFAGTKYAKGGGSSSSSSGNSGSKKRRRR